jgi:hypothetical protein
MRCLWSVGLHFFCAGRVSGFMNANCTLYLGEFIGMKRFEALHGLHHCAYHIDLNTC